MSQGSGNELKLQRLDVMRAAHLRTAGQGSSSLLFPLLVGRDASEWTHEALHRDGHGRYGPAERMSRFGVAGYGQ